MTVTIAAVAATKSLLGMCDCTVNSNVGTGNFSLLLGSLHVYGRVSEHGLVLYRIV